MSWIAGIGAILAFWVAYKIAGIMGKLVLAAVILFVAYLFAAPHVGLPGVGQLFRTFGPDIPDVQLPDIDLSNLDKLLEGLPDNARPASPEPGNSDPENPGPAKRDPARVD